MSASPRQLERGMLDVDLFTIVPYWVVREYILRMSSNTPNTLSQQSPVTILLMTVQLPIRTRFQSKPSCEKKNTRRISKLPSRIRRKWLISNQNLWSRQAHSKRKRHNRLHECFRKKCKKERFVPEIRGSFKRSITCVIFSSGNSPRGNPVEETERPGCKTCHDEFLGIC